MFLVLEKNKLIICILVALLAVGGVFGGAVRMTYVSAPVVAEEGSSISLPIVMYHNVNPSTKKQSTYSITPDQLEEDLKYFKEHSYTTVSVQEIIDYVYDNKPLPPKPILLTFDDGYYDNQYYALPLLKQYDMKGVIFVVGSYSENSTQSDDINPNYSYLTWEQIKELAEDQTFEIQSHTYDMHYVKGKRHGAFKARGESKEEYQMNFAADLNKLHDKLLEVTGKRPTAFAYPLGNVDVDSLEVLKEVGIKLTVISYQGVSKIKPGDPESLYKLKRILRTGKKNTKSIFESMLE